MARFKTFNSTGVPPDGVLFAGDENAMQDRAAELANFAQTVDLGTLRVGEAAIQLLKFATGEARLTGLLRVDGMLRGLGGLYAGMFTTAQRDSIAAGFRPFGIVIFNTTTGRFEWNAGSDAVPRWESLGQTELGIAQNTAGTIAVSNNQGAGSLLLQATNVICDGSPILIQMSLPWVKSGGAGSTVGFDIDTDAGAMIGTLAVVGSPDGVPVHAVKKYTPVAGTRTFTVYAWKSGSAGEVKTGVGGNTGGGGLTGVLDPGVLRITKAT
jgi:hypothetical protein